MRWRVALTTPLGGIENMAIDAALLERARVTAEGVVRVYSWSEPTLSLGRNQRALGIYSPERASERSVRVVRRTTGGRALLHNREITYSVTAPLKDSASLRASYRSINDALLLALCSMGVEAQVATITTRSPSPDSAPCFERPVAGELMFGGRKLVGSAQYRENGAMLQHGSILVYDDQPLVTALSMVSQAAIPEAATLADALGYAPTATDFAAAFFRVIRQTWDADATPLALHEMPQDIIDAARVQFADTNWTWRR